MDNDDSRRGIPTVHKKFNDALTLLAGDAAYNKTMSLLKQLNIDFPPFLYLVKKMVYRCK